MKNVYKIPDEDDISKLLAPLLLPLDHLGSDVKSGTRA
mgnify:CR=1 FL=1